MCIRDSAVAARRCGVLPRHEPGGPGTEKRGAHSPRARLQNQPATRAADSRRRSQAIGGGDVGGVSSAMNRARCSMLDARCSMLDARCSMLDARCSMLDARCSMLDARCSMRQDRRFDGLVVKRFLDNSRSSQIEGLLGWEGGSSIEKRVSNFGWAVGRILSGRVGGKSEIRNPKFEIALGLVSGIWYPVSGIQAGGSSMQYRASGGWVGKDRPSERGGRRRASGRKEELPHSPELCRDSDSGYTPEPLADFN